MSDEPRHLSELVRAGGIARLQREADRRRAETAELKRLLPPDEAAHVVSATVAAGGELIVVMDAPSWAARVRFSAAALPYKQVRVRVAPPGR
jgi:hypothetical protein